MNHWEYSKKTIPSSHDLYENDQGQYNHAYRHYPFGSNYAEFVIWTANKSYHLLTIGYPHLPKDTSTKGILLMLLEDALNACEKKESEWDTETLEGEDFLELAGRSGISIRKHMGREELLFMAADQLKNLYMYLRSE